MTTVGDVIARGNYNERYLSGEDNKVSLDTLEEEYSEHFPCGVKNNSNPLKQFGKVPESDVSFMTKNLLTERKVR